MATSTQKPSTDLDLTIFTQRPIIRIDGKPYELRTPNDLSLYTYKRLGRLLLDVAPVFGTHKLTKRQQQAASNQLDTLCRLILIAPDRIHRSLGDLNRTQIIETFITLFPPSLGRKRAAVEATRSPGGNSSRSSRASTAPTQAPGSTASRSGSSARTS